MNKLIGAVAGTALAVGAIGVATTAPAEAAPAKYKNCQTLNAKYPGGVAKSAKMKNTKTVARKTVSAQSSYTPKVSKSLYDKNKGLDRDKDGIACER